MKIRFDPFRTDWVGVESAERAFLIGPGDGSGVAMKSSWTTATGELARRWFEAEQNGSSISPAVPEEAEGKGCYLEPLPDFASHSPFGGATWFQPPSADRKRA